MMSLKLLAGCEDHRVFEEAEVTSDSTSSPTLGTLIAMPAVYECNMRTIQKSCDMRVLKKEKSYKIREEPSCFLLASTFSCPVGHEQVNLACS